MKSVQLKEYQIGVKIINVLTQAGYTAYFAGGCVRDYLMDERPTDFDIATDAKPEAIEKLFPKTIPVGKQFGVEIVVEDGINFEVATFRTEGKYLDGRHPEHVKFVGPEEDASRRDFTINGIFYDPKADRIIDYVKGQSDIKAKLIRTIGDPYKRFEEDKLRLLRAIRFASNLSFSIEPATWSAIKKMAPHIKQVSAERIRDELIKLFTRANAGEGLELLSESGLLKEILPEIEAMKGVEQPPDYHPEGDVFVHTKIIMSKLQNPSVELAFGALFHDIGKPATFSNEGGKIRFYNHSRIGKEMAETVLRRLKFSNKEIESICSCVDNHMTFGDVQKMREGKLKQFVTRENFPTELEMHKIDCESSHGILDNYFFLKEKLVQYEQENLKPKPFITGHDLIGLGLKPGPLMKQILEEAYTLQLESKWKDRDEVLEWVRQKFL